MATRAASAVQPEVGSSAEPLLETGDRLSRDEFERRYEAVVNYLIRGGGRRTGAGADGCLTLR